MNWLTSSFFINKHNKIRKNDPDDLFDIINLFIFPIITFINFIIVTVIFSQALPTDNIVDEVLFNKVIIYIIVFFLWILFPIVALIKKPFSIERSNTLFFGSFLFYSIFMPNLYYFYIGFFIMMSRNTSFGIKFKYFLKNNHKVKELYKKLFPKINKTH